MVQSIYMFCKGFHLPCSDFDPGVVHKPEPVVPSHSCEGNQVFEVGYYWGSLTRNTHMEGLLSQQPTSGLNDSETQTPHGFLTAL